MRHLVRFLVFVSIGQPAMACQQFPMLFFDFNSAVPRAEGVAQLQQFASDTLRRGEEVKLIGVIGHSDRTGPLRARESIAIRRAEAVRSQLIMFGVPQDLMKASSAADRSPLYPTSDHVREPQNRRVELVVVWAERPAGAGAPSTAGTQAAPPRAC
jgi:outer membrane protein OmpA-like peptidoglycan-associated protein